MSKTDDILYGDVLIELALVLGVRETEGCINKVIGVELTGCGIAYERADIAVHVFAANFLQDNLALGELGTVLLGDGKGIELIDYFEEISHTVYDLEFVEV